MKNSERWRAVGHIVAEQSITNAALSFGNPHSVVSQLYKQFLTSQTVIQRHVADHQRVTTLVRGDPDIKSVAQDLEGRP